MQSAFRAMSECGFGAWLCVLIGLLGCGMGFVGLVVLALKKRGAALLIGGLAIACGVLAIGAGVMARQMGLAKVEAAVSGELVEPSIRERIRAEGRAEAGRCIEVGAATSALPFVLGVGLGLLIRKP